MYNLASLLTNQGRYPEALALLEENRAARGKVYPPDHPRTLRLLVNLSDLYARVGRDADQIRLLEEALAAQKRVLGPDHPDTLKTMIALADAYSGSRPAAAEPLAREAWKSQRARFGLGHRYTVEALVSLSGVLLTLGRSAETEQALRETLPAIKGGDSVAAFDRWRAMSMLGAVLTAQRRGQEAEPYLLKAYEGVAGASTGPGEVDDLRTMGQRVVECYKSMRQLAKAAEWVQHVDTDLRRLKDEPQPQR
jgi:tetratricopeptide (TPR) repeat protein